MSITEYQGKRTGRIPLIEATNFAAQLADHVYADSPNRQDDLARLQSAQNPQAAASNLPGAPNLSELLDIDVGSSLLSVTRPGNPGTCSLKRRYLWSEPLKLLVRKKKRFFGHIKLRSYNN